MSLNNSFVHYLRNSIIVRQEDLPTTALQSLKGTHLKLFTKLHLLW